MTDRLALFCREVAVGCSLGTRDADRDKPPPSEHLMLRHQPFERPRARVRVLNCVNCGMPRLLKEISSTGFSTNGRQSVKDERILSIRFRVLRYYSSGLLIDTFFYTGIINIGGRNVQALQENSSKFFSSWWRNLRKILEVITSCILVMMQTRLNTLKVTE